MHCEVAAFADEDLVVLISITISTCTAAQILLGLL
jgi:hypothetical protein